MEIWLIRHTTPHFEKGICYGQLDLDVNDAFKAEAKQIKEHLSDTSFDLVYSSPLLRCRKLANELFPNDDLKYSNLIKEIDFGDWEGKYWSSIPQDEMKQWSADYVSNPVPNGESFEQLIQRTNAFIGGLKHNSNEKAAIVTHSGIIRAFLIKYLQIPPTKAFSLDLSFGCIVKITIHSEEYQQVKFIKP
ncbi:MAG: alpha-ribazole phosphatase [Bacteroidales bacterium]|nr:alpha-ribazole phosphatase [Bacteroidales bacterium]